VQRSAKWMGFSELKCDQFANSAAETTWRYLRWFHAPSSAVMVATLSLEKTLEAKGFRNIVSWSRGVDTDQFQPYGKDFSPYAELPRPVLVYMGRVAPEKNIDAFLSLDLPGSKVVVGDGPVLNELRARFPNALFVGKKEGEELGRHVAAGDIFVFPSMADTFGLVVLEALACGVPVAAYPVTGPIDILKDKACGSFSCLNGNLKEAVLQLLAMREVGQIDAVAARRYVSENYSWKTATEQFCNNLQDNTEVAQRKTKRLGRVAAAINPWRLLRPRNGG
jgi:glycosyltransferase involved in cell wall biosynthesis